MIWLDNVVCVGNESHLINCSNNGIGVHDCDHAEDVAIYCEPRKCTIIDDDDIVMACGSTPYLEMGPKQNVHQIKS